MPLSGIRRRTAAAGASDLAAFTVRELYVQRRLAERSLARGRRPDRAATLVARIDAELEARRTARLARHPLPDIG